MKFDKKKARFIAELSGWSIVFWFLIYLCIYFALDYLSIASGPIGAVFVCLSFLTVIWVGVANWWYIVADVARRRHFDKLGLPYVMD